MRYNVDCPHCGKPRSLPDSGLWPDRWGTPEYPAPSQPQECLDCPGWMRVVLVGDEATVEKCGLGWDDDAPDWQGSDGKPVEFLMSNGSVLPGRFELDDSWFTGEESVPCWYVVFEDGKRLSFYDNTIAGWRLRPAP